MKTRRTDDPDIYFMSTDGVPLWCYGIVEWKIDARGGKFILTPVNRDGSEGPIADATELFNDYKRERRR